MSFDCLARPVLLMPESAPEPDPEDEPAIVPVPDDDPGSLSIERPLYFDRVVNPERVLRDCHLHAESVRALPSSS